EHRRVIRANARLAWEQALLNEIGDELRNLLAPEQLVERVLHRLMKGMAVSISAARLRNRESGAYDYRIISAPPQLREAWLASEPLLPRPSDRVRVPRQPLRIDDLHADLPPELRARVPLRATLSVPMLVGEDLIGAMNVGSAEPGRFTADDQ